ncbi:MAG: hypothetical protein GY710_05710 [Desulfobacteraceae bacterium]|nr:hypothetical protein [Desulfobacteraceae bacterium]
MTVAQPTMDTSESHGTWESTGIDEYATTDRAFIYDTQTGIASAIRKMRSKITLDPGGETLSGTVIIDYLALDGSPVQTLETTVVGQRLHVEPIE